MLRRRFRPIAPRISPQPQLFCARVSNSPYAARPLHPRRVAELAARPPFRCCDGRNLSTAGVCNSGPPVSPVERNPTPPLLPRRILHLQRSGGSIAADQGCISDLTGYNSPVFPAGFPRPSLRPAVGPLLHGQARPESATRPPLAQEQTNPAVPTGYDGPSAVLGRLGEGTRRFLRLRPSPLAAQVPNAPAAGQPQTADGNANKAPAAFIGTVSIAPGCISGLQGCSSFQFPWRPQCRLDTYFPVNSPMIIFTSCHRAHRQRDSSAQGRSQSLGSAWRRRGRRARHIILLLRRLCENPTPPLSQMHLLHASSAEWPCQAFSCGHLG